LSVEDIHRMSCKMIEVCRESFRFQAVPKHCDDSEACWTDRVKLEELENNTTMNKITL
jgi:hypothetical protein